MCPLGMEPATFWCTGCSTKSYSGQGYRLIPACARPGLNRPWMCQDNTRTSRSTGWHRALTNRASGRPGLLPGLCGTGIMKRLLPLGSVARMKQGLLRRPVWCQLNRCAGLPPSSSITWTLSTERRRPQERLLSLSLHRAPGETSPPLTLAAAFSLCRCSSVCFVCPALALRTPKAELVLNGEML